MLGRVLLPILLSFAVLGGPSIAQGADLFVDAAAPPGYEDGTPTYPFHGIQDALDAALPGDIVRVRPGIYFGTVWLADQVQLISEEGPEQTVIDGMGSMQGALQSPPDDGLTGPPASYVEGFTIRNGRYFLVHAVNNRSFWAVSYFDLHHCVLEGDGTQTGMYVMPAVVGNVTRTELRNLMRGFDAIWSKPYLDNLTIHDVESAYFLYQPYHCRIRNNVVSSVQNVVEVWGSYGYAYVQGSHNDLWDYELLGKPNNAGRYPDFLWSSNLSVDPLFTDPSLGDYTLQAASPLVDAGTDVGLPYSGIAPEIGAYERDGSLWDSAQGLAEFYGDVSTHAYETPQSQRRNALAHKLIALLHALDAGSESGNSERIAALQGARQRLLKDIWAKSDGHFGGQAANDWIVTLEEQTRLKEKVDELLADIDAELSTLGG